MSWLNSLIVWRANSFSCSFGFSEPVSAFENAVIARWYGTWASRFSVSLIQWRTCLWKLVVIAGKLFFVSFWYVLSAGMLV